MRLPIPGPLDVLGAAVTVRDTVSRGLDAVGAAADLVPRAALLLDRTAALLDRVEAVVDDVEVTVRGAQDAVRSGSATAAAAADLLEQTARTARNAETLVATSGTVLTKADRAVAGATGVLDRVDHLVSELEPLARRLLPSAQRFAEQLHPKEVDAAIALVDQLPRVLEHVEGDVLPMLQQLQRVGPDVHQILEVVQDLREAVTGLPGIGLLMRRGERRDEDDVSPAR